MSKGKRSLIVQVLIYAGILAYVAGDLLIFGGPISRLLAPADEGHGKAAVGVVARVHGQPISSGQLDHELEVYAFRRGMDLESLPENRVQQLRTMVLYRLIDDHLLRIKARFNSGELEVDEDRWQAEWKSWQSRFASELQMEKALAAHGLTKEEMRYRFAAKQQQEQWLSRWLAKQESISDEAVQSFYESEKEQFERPEQRHVRHIFSATLDHPGGEASKLIDEWTLRLRAGEESWEAAAQKSEDLASAKNGGDLGWISGDRLPEQFAKAVFSMNKGESAKIESRLGVHWVQVLDIKAARIPTLPEVEDEIRRALNLRWRKQLLKEFRDQMRKEAIGAEQILIFEHGGIQG